MDPKASFKAAVDQINEKVNDNSANTETCPICGAEEKSGHICSHCAKILAENDTVD